MIIKYLEMGSLIDVTGFFIIIISSYLFFFIIIFFFFLFFFFFFWGGGSEQYNNWNEYIFSFLYMYTYISLI